MSVRLVVRALSELCITVGAVLVLFVGYVLYWSGVRADAAMDEQLDRLRDRWSTGAVATSPEPRRRPYAPGEPFAAMYVPRFGADWVKPVLEGTSPGTLAKGLGHYPRTARLGERGNFAVAGHRRTHGDPFKDFPRLRPGDAVVLSDGTTWYTYRVDRRPYRTRPSDTAVLDPVPAASGHRRSGRYLTLTTCDPEWGHSHRLIAWAHLDATAPVGAGKPDALRS
ncbi:class E sortase [Streptomyces sp. LX-29]|uniref:class E sortase n=1 Tax=Streptomyces sp. LX-29 TaxID=2900152 RepID=UPI00240E0DBD|nr:class E sortase [Streptomyces sp. LX-29]WFB08491.1 class E sortase [Streptomyces sp. LX-29]